LTADRRRERHLATVYASDVPWTSVCEAFEPLYSRVYSVTLTLTSVPGNDDGEKRANKTEVVTLPAPEYHAMFAQSHRLRV